MPKQIETYTLDELKDIAPDAYAKVLKWWEDSACDDIPWTDETMASLKATIKACGARLTNWSIGAYSQSSLSVSVNDDYEDTDEEGNDITVTKDDTWLYEEVLKPLGYTIDSVSKSVTFPGLCPFTGHCADDAFLESVYKDMVGARSTLTEALENLAGVASRLMEDDCEQAQSEESMMANWGDNQYTIDGIEV